MSKFMRKTLTIGLLGGSCIVAACHQPSGSDPTNQLASNTAAALPALPASMPMQTGPAAPFTAAPPVAALPSAPRPALRRLADPGSGYAYLDRAASYDDAIGQAPPDYAFSDGGVSPWGWQAGDGSAEYAEPIDGGYRHYYYQPGASTPYLVRDPSYSYAYDGAALVMVYDHGGHPLPPNAYGPRWDYAGRYLARAQQLRAAAQADRHSVVAANWAARRAEIAAANAQWSAARARDAAWSAYHARAVDQQSDHWQAERDARAQAAQRFATDQGGGFQGPPPALGRAPGQVDRAGPPPQQFAVPPVASRPAAEAAVIEAQSARRQADQARMVQHEHDQQAERLQAEQASAAARQAAQTRAEAQKAAMAQRVQADRQQRAVARQAIDRRQQPVMRAPAVDGGSTRAPHPDRSNHGVTIDTAPPHAPLPRERAEQPRVSPQPHAAPQSRSTPPQPHPPSREQNAPGPHAERPPTPRSASQPHAPSPGDGAKQEHEHGHP